MRLSATTSYSIFCPFIQITHARPFDCADMHKYVGAAGVRLDKSKTLRALNHFTVPIAMMRSS